MKPIYCIFCMILFFVACEDDDMVIEEPLPYWGEITALKNGEAWSASPYARIESIRGDGLVIISYVISSSRLKKEAFSFTKIPFSPGTHPVFFTSAQQDDGKVGARFSILDHDAILASYIPLESDSTNFITLESYDETSGEVKGTFEITFVVKGTSSTVQEPDTIRFTNGVFHTRIWED